MLEKHGERKGIERTRFLFRSFPSFSFAVFLKVCPNLELTKMKAWKRLTQIWRQGEPRLLHFQKINLCDVTNAVLTWYHIGETDKMHFIKKLVQGHWAVPMNFSCCCWFFSAGADFCKHRESGLYPDPDDCAGFIICNIGKAHRQKCAPPQLLRADTMNCDLPERVDCGTRPRLYDVAQGFYLTDTPQAHYDSYIKPAPGTNRG